MKFKFIVATLALLPVLAIAQSSPVLLGTWKGMGPATVVGSGSFHPSEAGKENNIRYRNVEFVLVIDKEEGRNFSGYLTATSKSDSTDTNYKAMILGSSSKDMKNGVWVSELGTATYKLVDPNNLEVCYTHIAAQYRVGHCYELVKQ